MHRVTLVFFEDDADGKWGIAPKQCMENVDYPFNAFWNGVGIFHDVFEHWFEGQHKYFKGHYAINYGGEIAALGAAMFYYYTLTIGNRPLPGTFEAFSEVTCREVSSNLVDAFNQGHLYGGELMCNVPRYQPKVDCSETEAMIDRCVSIVMSHESDGEVDEQGDIYKKSVTSQKIKDLFRYGWRMGNSLTTKDGNYMGNGAVLVEFINSWQSVTEEIEAETMQYYFREIQFKVSKRNNAIYWKATFKSIIHYGYDVTLTQNTLFPATKIKNAIERIDKQSY